MYTTKVIHFCLERSLHVVGLGECVVRTIKHDPEQRMCPEELEKQIDHDNKVMFIQHIQMQDLLHINCVVNTCLIINSYVCSSLWP